MKIENLVTEQQNPATMKIDQLKTKELLQLINQEDQKVAQAVATQLDIIAQAVDLISQRFKAGGRLIYCGAGTSGRLGVLDAAELVPTFGLAPQQALGLIAGGKAAMFQAVEGAEDDQQLAIKDLQKINFSGQDTLIAIASSGRTPYVIGAVDYCHQVGGKSVAVVCVPNSKLAETADLTIAPIVGPEVITGSTRMKAGTAQKMVLNMLSTGVMIKVGKVYQNLMVDVLPTNEKLVRRALKIIKATTAKNNEDAKQLLVAAHQRVPVAIVMGNTGLDYQAAVDYLKENNNQVAAVIHNWNQKNHLNN
ncbi:N-acetylmuramic acid 6-phosphate etherase [Liquorilactobacillus nagelii]|uniref:N-acetylmuramic acid 6-phosphate etherase n=1 Tax=Liquorilactobacillus nagelii TaxID=82688 RepID=UPI001CD020C0|nr:N-acetylmuramic acid 6-phosphate etherase [Liquorilactobacillus nagelii]ULQ48982.1 N-acetylmuramic acid 6-phosphate etherase [Liquorilactobacillus nagelii]